MKEADIKFDVVYAVKDPDGGSPRSATVLEKCPVRPGQKRSRTYRVQYSNSPYQDDIDASAILEPWSEHEKTLSHAIKIMNSTGQEAQSKLIAAWQKWQENFEFYLESRFPTHNVYIRNVHIPPPRTDDDFDSVKNNAIDVLLRNSTVTIPLKDFVESLGEDEGLLYPPIDSFEAAFETYKESVEAVETQIVIPRAIKVVREVLAGDRDDDYSQAMSICWDAAAEYDDNPVSAQALAALKEITEAAQKPDPSFHVQQLNNSLEYNLSVTPSVAMKLQQI